MQKIQLNGEKTLEIPAFWGEVSLKTYEEYINASVQTGAERIARIGILCGLTIEETLQLPAGVFTYIAEIMQFSTHEPDLTPANSVTLDGVEYYANIDGGGLSLAEWVDIKTAQKEGYNPLSEVLSIILRPVGEKYDAKTATKRKERFEEAPVSVFFGVLGFFLQCKIILLLHTSKKLTLTEAQNP